MCDVCGGLPTGGDCCQPHDAPGCDDQGCAAAVCDADPFCCFGTWDQPCADLAAELCDACAGPPTGGDCCVAHNSPGCDDQACTAAVCEVDSFCCNASWDGICANEAADMCDVCAGPPTGGDCCQPHDAPGCGDQGCAATVCGIDPFCCDATWDGICADEAAEMCDGCGGAPAGGDCCAPHDAAGCADEGCAAVVCEGDPFCCEAEWDDLCAGQASDVCLACATPPPTSDCCGAHDTPGCSDAACQQTVCAQDGWCCTNSWDDICSDLAGESCASCASPGPDADCCQAHPEAGCGDAACVEVVCAADPFCCEQSWDGLCAGQAASHCAACGASGGGDGGSTTTCCVESNAAGCADPGCQALVCAADPFCCDTQWDTLCVMQAEDLCGLCESGTG